MSYSIIRLDNHPIVIVHVRGSLNAAVHFQIAMKVSRLAENHTGKFYLVLDLSMAHMDLIDTVDVLAQMTRSWRGTPSDSRIITMLVTRGGNTSLIAGHLVKQWEGWRRVFVFSSMAQALASARGPIIVEREEAITPKDSDQPSL
jgi:hypothetical protein